MKWWPAYIRYGYWTWRKLGRWSWPSRLQRLHIQGDPTGEVKRVADQILNEINGGTDR